MACVFLRDRCRVRSSENKPIHTLTDPPMQFSIRCWFIAFHSPTTVGSRSSANHLTSSYLLGVSNPDRPQARAPRKTQDDQIVSPMTQIPGKHRKAGTVLLLKLVLRRNRRWPREDSGRKPTPSGGPRVGSGEWGLAKRSSQSFVRPRRKSPASWPGADPQKRPETVHGGWPWRRRRRRRPG